MQLHGQGDNVGFLDGIRGSNAERRLERGAINFDADLLLGDAQGG
jgi:hypothetical protein